MDSKEKRDDFREISGCYYRNDKSRDEIIKLINENLNILTTNEITKVYKFIRTKIIANI